MQTKFTTGDRVTLHLPARIVAAMESHGTIYYSVTDGRDLFPLMISEEYITKDEGRINLGKGDQDALPGDRRASRVD